MKLKTATLGLALLMLAGCGDLGLGQYKLESGTYKVSSATLASGSDTCGLLGAYTNPAKEIGISAGTETVTFNLPNDPTLETIKMPTATLTHNSLVKLNEANFITDWNGDCVTRTVSYVDGDVTADDSAALVLTYSVTREAGTCGSESTIYPTVPCSSNIHFLANKQ
jgi:hypothetical protein